MLTLWYQLAWLGLALFMARLSNFPGPTLLAETHSPTDCQQPLKLAEILARPVLSQNDDFALSPNGDYLAYGLRLRPERPLVGEHYLGNGVPAESLESLLQIVDIRTHRVIDVCPPGISAFRPSWSPDGRTLAFYSDEGGKVGLWEFDLGTQKRTRLISSEVKVSLWPGDEPAWSPDGKTLYASKRPAEVPPKSSPPKNPDPEKAHSVQSGPAYLAPGSSIKSSAGMQELFRRENLGRIVAIDRATHRVRTIVAETAKIPPSIFRLSPSGKWLAYLSPPAEAETGGRALRDLAILKSSGGIPRATVRELPAPAWEYNQRNYRWHPKEDLLVYIQEGQLWTIDVRPGADGMPHPLRPEIRGAVDEPLRWDRSGKALLVGVKPTTRPDYPLPVPTALAWIPLDEKQAVKWFSLAANERFRGALPASDTILWSEGKTAFAIQVESSGDPTQAVGQTPVKILGFDPETSSRMTLWEGEAQFRFSPHGSADGVALVARFENEETPPDLFQFQQLFQKKIRLTQRIPSSASLSGFSKRLFATQTKLPTGEKQMLNTMLFLPAASAGTKPPTVVIGYPGDDLTRTPPTFAGGDPTSSLPTEILLRAGYAVALVHLPMSSEGKASEPVQEMTAALLPQVDHLAESGLVDPQRFALLGQSYGGYFAAAVPTLSSRFKASVAISGIYDLTSQYGVLTDEGVSPGIPWAEGGQGRMGGPPFGENLQRYLRNSPYFQADRIHTPLLLIQGTQDSAFPQATSLFTVLRRLGQNAEIAIYPSEGRVPAEWTLLHQTEAVEKTLAFLRKFLGSGTCPPSPAETLLHRAQGL